jgi:hypothetical protein
MTYRASESNERLADYVTLQIHTQTTGAKSDKRYLIVICTVHKEGRRDNVFVSANNSSPENVHDSSIFWHGFRMITMCEVSSIIKRFCIRASGFITHLITG